MQTLTEDDYAAIDMQFDMSHIINVLTLKYVEKIKVGGKTRKAEYEQTFKDAASVAKYGPKKKTITLHKKTDFSAYAAAVFAKNADPANVPQSVTVTICQSGYQSGALPDGYADGTYVGSKIGIVDPNGGTYTARVRRIEHHITPDTWTMQIFLRNQDVIQPPRTGVSRDTVTSEVANNPDGQVLTAHLEDGAVDGAKLATEVDATGKTVLGAALTSGDFGGRVEVNTTDHLASIGLYSGADNEVTGASIIAQDVVGNSILTVNPPVNTDGSQKMFVNGRLDADDIHGSGPMTVLDSITSTNELHGNDVFVDGLPTTTQAANANLSSPGGRVRLSTSLSKFKLNQQPLTLDDALGLLDLTPITWHDRSDVEANDGSTEGLHRIAGVTAEDVEAHVPALAEYDAEGNLQGVAYDRMASALLLIVNDQQKRIRALEARLGRNP